MSESINSPFRYAGGKFYARKLILSHIKDHNCYIEPFCGGASIFFCKDKVARNILNDIDEQLINTLKIIRDKPDLLISKLKIEDDAISIIPKGYIEGMSVGEPLPATKELHYYFKNIFVPNDDISYALRWFYLNRTSYSGIMNFKNMYWGYGDKYSMQPKNWARNILKTSNKLQGVELMNVDFEVIIDNAPSHAFLFIDPPYFNADQNKFYEHFFSENDHYRLLDCLLRNKERLNYFITYDNNETIKEMYSWADKIYDEEWNYCIQRTDDQKNKTQRKGQRYKGKELFIINYLDK